MLNFDSNLDSLPTLRCVKMTYFDLFYLLVQLVLKEVDIYGDCSKTRRKSQPSDAYKGDAYKKACILPFFFEAFISFFISPLPICQGSN